MYFKAAFISSTLVFLSSFVDARGHANVSPPQNGESTDRNNGRRSLSINPIRQASIQNAGAAVQTMGASIQDVGATIQNGATIQSTGATIQPYPPTNMKRPPARPNPITAQLGASDPRTRPLYSVNPLNDVHITAPLNNANPLDDVHITAPFVGNPLQKLNPADEVFIQPVHDPLDGMGNQRPLPSFGNLPHGVLRPASGLANQLATLELDIARLRGLLTGGMLTYEGLAQNIDFFQTDLGMLQLELFNLKREGLLSTSIQLPGFDVISFNIGAVLNRETGKLTYTGIEGLGNNRPGIGGHILNNVGELSQIDLEHLRAEALKAKAEAGFGNNVLLPGGVPFAPQGGLGGNFGSGGVGENVAGGISDGIDFAKDKIDSGLGAGFGGLDPPGIIGGMENAGDTVAEGLSDIGDRLRESNLDSTFDSLTNSLLSISTGDEGATKKYMRQSIAHAVELRNILYDQDWNVDYPAVDSTIKSLDNLIDTLKQGAWGEFEATDPSAVESFMHDLNSRTHTVGWDIQRIGEEFGLNIPTEKLRNYSYMVPMKQTRPAANLRRT